MSVVLPVAEVAVGGLSLSTVAGVGAAATSLANLLLLATFGCFVGGQIWMMVRHVDARCGCGIGGPVGVGALSLTRAALLFGLSWVSAVAFGWKW